MFERETIPMPSSATSKDQLNMPDQLPESEAQLEIERLRQLILGDDNLKRIESLNDKEELERLVNLLPKAITERSEKDDHIAQALSGIISGALQRSIEKEPQLLIHSLYPILGSMVRQSVKSSISETMQAFNDLLSQSLNFRSIGERYIAWRKGQSYAEFLLIKTLQFRVEEVLLIHRETGLLLNFVVAEAIENKDPDLVSSMLTAIIDFITDAFSKNENDNLESIRFGDLNLEIKNGPDTILVAAVRGMHSGIIRDNLNYTDERIYQEYSKKLIEFNGDIEPFKEVKLLLTDCLIEKRIEPKVKKPTFAIIVIALIVCFIGYWGFNEWRISKRAENIVDAFRQQPNYQLIDHSYNNHQLHLELMQSFKAKPPEAILTQMDQKDLIVTINRVKFPFNNVAFLLPIIRNEYNLDPSITLFIDKNKVLFVRGPTELLTQELKSQLQQNFILKNEVKEIRFEIIKPKEAPKPEIKIVQMEPKPVQLTLVQLRKKVAEQIESTLFYFDSKQVTLNESEAHKLVALVIDIKLLYSYSEQMNQPPPQILILGFADSDGNSAQVNLQAGKKRANTIKEMLVANGISDHFMIAWGIGNIQGDTLPTFQQRRVSFTVNFPEAK